MNIVALLAFFLTNLSEISNDCFKRNNPQALSRTAHKYSYFCGTDGDVARLDGAKPGAQSLA